MMEKKNKADKEREAGLELGIGKVLDALPFYAILVDAEHRILFANKVVKEEFGVDPEKSIGRYCPKLIHGTEGPIPECPLEEAVEKGETSVEREFFDSSSGRWVNSAVYQIKQKTEGGQLIFFHTIYDITRRKKAEQELGQSLKKLREALEGAVHVLRLAVERRDPYTSGHQQRVSDLTRAIATNMGFSKQMIEGICMAAAIHDVGKIEIPGEILSKPTHLTDIELSLIRNHPRAGYEIVKEVDFPWPLAKIILQHHERLDGSGYPQGLKSDDIILEARILGVADVVEAMSSHRPYRPALGINKALEHLVEKKGILYDPEVVEVCLRVFEEEKFDFE